MSTKYIGSVNYGDTAVDAIPRDDVLVARAMARHIRDLRTPTPSLVHSAVLQYAGKTWIELRTEQNEVAGIYQYYPNSGQLRRH